MAYQMTIKVKFDFLPNEPIPHDRVITIVEGFEKEVKDHIIKHTPKVMLMPVNVEVSTIKLRNPNA